MSTATHPRPYRAVVRLVVAPSIVVAVLMATLYIVVLPVFPIVHRYYFPEQVQTYATYWVPLYIHIIAGTAALVLGPINLVLGLRGRGAGKLHPRLGRAYAVAVAVSAPAAIFLAFHSYAGTMPGGRIVSTTGFATLGVLWVVTMALAVQAIVVRRSVSAHRFWMIVNVSLVYAAVTLRVQNGALLAMGLPTFEALYPILAWSSWVPNLLVAVFIARRIGRRNPDVSTGLRTRLGTTTL